MDESMFIGLFKQFGPIVMLLAFFIWRDQKREERLGQRLDAMQDRYQQTMEGVVKDAVTAMNNVADATRETGRAVNSLKETLMLQRSDSRSVTKERM